VPSKDEEDDDKYSVIMPKFVGVHFNNHTVVGPRNLLSKVTHARTHARKRAYTHTHANTPVGVARSCVRGALPPPPL